MNYFEAFEKVKKSLNGATVPASEPPFAVQVRLNGAAAGTLYILFSDGRVIIEPYDYYDNDADILTDIGTLFKVIEHKIDIGKAVSDGLMAVSGNKIRLAELFGMIKTAKKRAPKKTAPKASKKKAESKKMNDKKKPKDEDVIKEVVKTETKPEK